MDPKSIIESYVDDVVLLLPARQRKDVGIELRELLFEELANRAGDTPVDEAATRAFLKEFGAPGDVAARYRPAGATVIPAREGRFFAWICIAGVLFQWALSFPGQVLLATHDTFWVRLGVWSFGSAIHAFALPGMLAVCALIWAWRRHSVTNDDQVILAIDGDLEPLQPIQPLEVNRVLWGVAVVGFAVAIPLYASVPQILADLPEPARTMFALDETFVRERAPWMLVVWVAQLALFIAVLVEGFWRPALRRIEMALNLAGAALLAWFGLAGPIAQNADFNTAAKLIVAGVATIILVVTAISFWREQARVGDAKPKLS